MAGVGKQSLTERSLLSRLRLPTATSKLLFHTHKSRSHRMACRLKKIKEHRPIAWNDLQNVKMTNNSLFLRGKDGIDKELNITHLEYRRLRSGTYICSVEVSGSKLM